MKRSLAQTARCVIAAETSFFTNDFYLCFFFIIFISLSEGSIIDSVDTIITFYILKYTILKGGIDVMNAFIKHLLWPVQNV